MSFPLSTFWTYLPGTRDALDTHLPMGIGGNSVRRGWRAFARHDGMAAALWA